MEYENRVESEITIQQEVIEIGTLKDLGNIHQNFLIQDENHIFQVGTHNHEEFLEMVKSKGNTTVVTLLYARK